MIDLKKLDEKEVVFDNKKPSKKEDLEFSNFLKNRKSTKIKLTSKKHVRKENV